MISKATTLILSALLLSIFTLSLCAEQMQKPRLKLLREGTLIEAIEGKLVKEKNGIVVMVSNGYVNTGPLEDLTSVTDAWNIDLKAWNDDFYRNVCGGDLATAKNSIETVAASNCHLELTWLLIPGHNDDPSEIEGAAEWIREKTGENTTLHVSRYFPRYRMSVSATPVSAVNKAAELFRKQLNNVYTGNI